nr:NAD(+)/NADH kinase [uncultured Mediterraneibacter sp.]
MESFYIITNQLKDRDYSVTIEIKDYIERKGKRVILAQKDEEGFIVPGTVPEDADCGLVLGGDGTLIRAIRDLEGSRLPLLGINIGTLGYLTDVELKDYKSAIDRLCEEDPNIEKRMMLEGVMSSGEKDLAVNDIVLTREGNLRIVKFNVYVNGTLLNTYQADGVIICTPTGSTGYNLSAGGPVVEPTASLMVITPICSHALNTSSVVLSAEDDVEVEICEGRYGRQEEVALCYDGAVQRKLVSGDRVKIRKADATAHLVKLSEESFMITMREKMKGN